MRVKLAFERGFRMACEEEVGRQCDVGGSPSVVSGIMGNAPGNIQRDMRSVNLPNCAAALATTWRSTVVGML
jgi:hypothetical protein